MSRNNATFVTNEQLGFLKEMDSWLSKEPWQSEVELQTAMEVRNLITKIESKGYYYEDGHCYDCAQKKLEYENMMCQDDRRNALKQKIDSHC